MAKFCRKVSWRSTSVLFLLATVANIAFAFIGGLLLYLESLREIEKGVEEISAAELELNRNKLRASFSDVFWTSKHTADTIRFNGTTTISTYTDVQASYLASQLAVLFNAESMYALGIFVAPLGDTNASDPAGVGQVTWWDPLTKPDAIEKNGGPKQWVTAWYLPSHYKDPSCYRDAWGDTYPPSKRRCAHAYSVGLDGKIQDNIYNYSEFNSWGLQSGQEADWDRASVGWEENGATFWRTLSVWQSEDDTKYSYASFVRLLPRVDIPPFNNSKVAVITYVSFYGWFNHIDNDTEATMMAATLADGDDSVVLASNIDVGLLRADCQSIREDSSQLGVRAFCQLTLSELPLRYQQAARFLNSTPYNAFRTASLDGEAHWVRRANIFTAQTHDMLDSIDLLWMRTHSTVQEKVKKSLINFVCFVGGSAVLSTIVLTLLVLGISVPLGQVTEALYYLDDMELEIAEDELPPIRTMQVMEVSLLVGSVKKALAALKMYREFLPQGCLNVNAPEEEEVAESLPDLSKSARPSVVGTLRSMRRKSRYAASSRRSSVADDDQPGIRQLLGAALEQRTVSVAVLNVVGFHSEDKNVHRQKGLLAVVMQSKLDGVLDGCVGDRTRVSWNGSRVVGSQKVRATKFVEMMRAHTDSSFVLSIAATAGPAKCGVAGCDGFRYFTLIGPHISFAYVAERVARKEAATRRASVSVVSKILQEDAATSVECRFLMQLKFSKLSADAVLFETTSLSTQEAANDEWMYDLMEKEKSSTWALYNSAAKLCASGSEEQAVKQLYDRPPTGATEIDKAYASFAEKMASAVRGEIPLPTAVRTVCDLSLELSS